MASLSEKSSDTSTYFDPPGISLPLLVASAENVTPESLSLAYITRQKRHPTSKTPFTLITNFTSSPQPFYIPSLEALFEGEDPSHVYYCLQMMYASTQYSASLTAATMLLERCVKRFFPKTSKSISVTSIFAPHLKNLYTTLISPSDLKTYLLPLLLTRGVPGLVNFTLHVLQTYKPSLKSGAGLPASVDCSLVASSIGGRLGKNIRRGKMPSDLWSLAYLQSVPRSDATSSSPSSTVPAVALRIQPPTNVTPTLLTPFSPSSAALSATLPPTHCNLPLQLKYQATRDGYGYEALTRVFPKMTSSDLIIIIGGHNGQAVGAFLRCGLNTIGSGESFVLESSQGYKWKPPR